MENTGLTAAERRALSAFLAGKSEQTIELFSHFVEVYRQVGEITLHPAKTMIGIDNGKKRVAWIIRLGKDFVNVVFPFKKPFSDNLCFHKIANVPGDAQYSHHLKLMHKDDVNEEVKKFMKVAYDGKN